MELCSCYVGGSCGEFARIKNLVAAGRDADAVRIVLLGSVGDDDLGVRWRLVLGDIRYVPRIHYKDCVRAFRARLFVALTHAAEVFAERRHPNFRSDRVVHELLVAGDVFARDGVVHCEPVERNVAGSVALVKVEGYEGL